MRSKERDSWYNQFGAYADATHWARMPYWTLEECVILLFGRDPRVVTIEKLNSISKISSFAKRVIEINELAMRAVAMDQLSKSNIPSIFLSWAKSLNLEVSVDVEVAVVESGNTVRSDRKTIEELTAMVNTQADTNKIQKETVDRLKEIIAVKTQEAGDQAKLILELKERPSARCSKVIRMGKKLNPILRYEASTGYADFKTFRIEHVISFRDKLDRDLSKTTGKPLSKSSISSVLSANKKFIFWLADQTGYKSRIRHSDADYFNMDAKGQRVANEARQRPYPSLEMARHAFNLMPETTEIERRNKAIFAFQMITGAGDGAVASLRLKHINLIDGSVYQDARDVKTKAAKTITTFFLPIDPIYTDCFAAWVGSLRTDRLFGPDDPLFPPPLLGHVEGEFKVTGLKRETYQNANAIRAVIKDAFTNAGLPPFTPHAFRITLVKWADTHYTTREGFKAFSQNIGHTSVVTTVSAYNPVSIERQAELIRKKKKPE